MVARPPERSTPLQNRVTPFGDIVAIPERGTMMGNRGILHDARHRIKRRWAGKAWISCVLEFRGRRDPVMAPGHYTRLFFLDEPTALAAGHRPCAYCRRAEYNAFRDAWAAGNHAAGLGPKPRAVEIDQVLNSERVGPGGSKRLHSAEIDRLPDGVLVTPVLGAKDDGPIARSGGEQWVRPAPPGNPNHRLDAFLVWRGGLWRWTPSGYQQSSDYPAGPTLTLTPPSIVAALAAGYAPRLPTGLA